MRRLDPHWLGVLALLAIVTIAYVDRVNVSVLVLDHGFLQRFGLLDDKVRQGLLMTVFLFGYGASALLLTPFYETFLSSRSGLIVSVVAWASLTALAPLTASLGVLLLLRCLLGLAEGPLFSLKVMFVAERFSAPDRGKPNAVSSMGVSLGLAAGYPLVATLMGASGWRLSFVALAAINIVVGLPLVLLLIRSPTPGADGGAARPAARMRTIVRGALATRQLGLILAVEVFTLAYLWGSSFWLPAYLAHDRHFTLSSVGWISAAPFMVSLCANLAGGALVDLVGEQRLPALFVVGGLTCAASVAGLLVARSDAATLAFLLCASAAWGLQSAAIPTLVQANAPLNAVGSAYGFINGIGNMASAFMPFAMGGLMKHSVASGFSLLVASQVAVCLCGALLLWTRRDRLA